jgi:hypothetical protein
MLQLICCWLLVSPRCLCLWLLCPSILTKSEMIWAFRSDCDSICLVIGRFKSFVLLWSFSEHLESYKKLRCVCQFVHPSVHPSMSVYVYQLTSSWIDFCEIWWTLFWPASAFYQPRYIKRRYKTVKFSIPYCNKRFMLTYKCSCKGGRLSVI